MSEFDSIVNNLAKTICLQIKDYKKLSEYAKLCILAKTANEIKKSLQGPIDQISFYVVDAKNYEKSTKKNYYIPS